MSTIVLAVLLAVAPGPRDCTAGVDAATVKSHFAAARAAGDVDGMEAAFRCLISKRTLRWGMTREQVEAVLGAADRSTGIYCIAGDSIGFGTEVPTTQNYDRFFWLDFRASGAECPQGPRGPEVLEERCAPCGEAG